MILVTDDAKLYYTEGLKASIDVSDKYNAEVVFYDYYGKVMELYSEH